MLAFGAYRMVYAAIFDWRINHIPLPRGTEGTHFPSSNGNMGGFEDAVFTRKATWGGDLYSHGVNSQFGARRGTDVTVAGNRNSMLGASTVVPQHYTTGPQNV